jgi:hypothetical protein
VRLARRHRDLAFRKRCSKQRPELPRTTMRPTRRRVASSSNDPSPSMRSVLAARRMTSASSRRFTRVRFPGRPSQSGRSPSTPQSTERHDDCPSERASWLPDPRGRADPCSWCCSWCCRSLISPR